MKPALTHHYATNRHHPEHYPDGVNGMNFIDLIEMFCDWKAVSERRAGNGMMRSVSFNLDKFKIDGVMRCTMLNSVSLLEDKPKTGPKTINQVRAERGIAPLPDSEAFEADPVYEVWIQRGLSWVRWAQKGGEPGPMTKEKAEEYADGLMDSAGVNAEVRKMPVADVIEALRKKLEDSERK